MRADTNNSDAQDSCTPMLNLAGTNCKNGYDREHWICCSCCKQHTYDWHSYIYMHYIALNNVSEYMLYDLTTTFYRIYKGHSRHHLPHNQARYPNQAQETSCRRVRGTILPTDILFLPCLSQFLSIPMSSPHSLKSQGYYLALFQNAGCARGQVLHSYTVQTST